MKVAQSLLIGLAMLVGLQSAYYYPQLPSKLASHFDAAGIPNGWSDRWLFFSIHFAIAALLLLIFLGMPSWVKRLPKERINLPNKDYWLAPERRLQTLNFIQAQFLWLGVASLALSLYIMQLVIQFNLKVVTRLSITIVWVLVAYSIFVLIWLVRFIRKFTRLP